MADDFDFGFQADAPYTPSGEDFSTPTSFGTGSDGSFWTNLMNSLSTPQGIATLLGAAGPVAGLLGTLSAGGQGPTTSGTQAGQTQGTTAGQTTGSRQNVGTDSSSRTGFTNTTDQATLDPAAQSAMDRLTAMLSGNAGAAQGAYGKGLSMLEQLASGTMGQLGQGASAIAGPNTTPSPAAVTGFPQALPTEYNPAIGNLIKQAMGSFVGDLGGQAITNARNRGFAGGADLLGSAAAPMMGQTLAQVPAMEAKAYLDHVLSAYGLQTQNAAAENAARSGALNAATNALGPGVSKYAADVSKYGIDRSADNAQLGQMTSLLQALMGPQQQLMTGNLNLLNAAPRGASRNTLTGETSDRTLSGSENTLSNTAGQTTGQTSGQTSGTTQAPLGPQIGNAVGNIFQGGAAGFAAADARERQAAQNRYILDLLAKRG